MTDKNKKDKKFESYYEPVTVQAEKYRGKYLNEKKAYERGLKPKEGSEGVMLWESSYKSKLEPYFSIEEELEPATEDEIFEFFEKLRLERNRKAREYYAEKKAEREWAIKSELKTAWQWLSEERRIPKEGAGYERNPEVFHYYDSEVGEWEDFTSSYWYYMRMDTRPATDWEYKKLKELYISKFGGWETIDLENTEYDGRVWWDYRILVPELEGQIDILDNL